MHPVRLSLHGANRALQMDRDVPIEALEGVRFMVPLLNEKPLRFTWKGIVIVACIENENPKIISTWRQRKNRKSTASADATRKGGPHEPQDAAA